MLTSSGSWAKGTISAPGAGAFGRACSRSIRCAVSPSRSGMPVDIHRRHRVRNGMLKVGRMRGARERKLSRTTMRTLRGAVGGRAETSALSRCRSIACGAAAGWHDIYCGLVRRRYVEFGGSAICRSREFAYKGRDVLTPLRYPSITAYGCRYGSESGIRVAGTADDEITVCYSRPTLTACFGHGDSLAHGHSASSSRVRSMRYVCISSARSMTRRTKTRPVPGPTKAAER